MLDLVVLALDAARGFVITDEPRVVAARSLASRDRGGPSRSAVRTALASERPRVWSDLRSDAIFAEIASVRALRLAALAAAPVRLPGGVRGAILVDWNRPIPGPVRRVAEILDRVAPILEQHRPGPARVDAPAPTARSGRGDLVGRSPSWIRAVADADAAARSCLPVLVEGETGTGKEALARRVHDRSDRATGPFVAINCAAVPESLIEGELFGAVRGAYTGSHRDRPGLLQQADGGSLFLDEIGEMPLPMQAKLLRAVQDKCVRPIGADRDRPADARVVAATHRDLDAEVARGRFRRDLFHRIVVLRVRLPPLRERPGDLEPLVAALAERLHAREGLPRARIEASAIARMRRHDWPGNVRELESVLARALVLRSGRPVRDVDLRFDAPTPALVAGDAPLEVTMIREALRSEPASLAAAARRIGWTRQKLSRRMRALGMTT